MTIKKSQIESAAGKLISAIQKEWGKELGGPEADISEEIMNKGHDLLNAAKNNNLGEVLNGMSVSQYLGDLWIQKHQSVKQAISDFEFLLNDSNNV